MNNLSEPMSDKDKEDLQQKTETLMRVMKANGMSVVMGGSSVKREWNRGRYLCMVRSRIRLAPP